MEIIDYPARPFRSKPLTDEDRQLLSQCYREIGELMKGYNVTFITPEEHPRAPSARQQQVGTPNA